MNKFILGFVSIFMLHQGFASFEDQHLERERQGWQEGRGSYVKTFPLDSLKITFISEKDDTKTTQVVTSIQSTFFGSFYHTEKPNLRAVLFNNNGREVQGSVEAVMLHEDNIFRTLDLINPYAVTSDGKVYARFKGLGPLLQYTLVK